jgi:hypothetical protein
MAFDQLVGLNRRFGNGKGSVRFGRLFWQCGQRSISIAATRRLNSAACKQPTGFGCGIAYDICPVAIHDERPLLDLLAENAEITKHVTRDQLAAMCDPAACLGQSGVMVDRVPARCV